MEVPPKIGTCFPRLPEQCSEKICQGVDSQQYRFYREIMAEQKQQLSHLDVALHPDQYFKLILETDDKLTWNTPLRRLGPFVHDDDDAAWGLLGDVLQIALTTDQHIPEIAKFIKDKQLTVRHQLSFS